MKSNLTREAEEYLRLGGEISANIGVLSPEVVEYFYRNEYRIREALTRGFVLPAKLALLIDLGIVNVPDDYDHSTQLAMFAGDHRQEFSEYNKDITDANFSNPSLILKPGDKLWVRVFRQVEGDKLTAEERISFCRAQPDNCFVGAQGLSLVWKQKRHQLLKSDAGSNWYSSFDVPERLWRNNEVPTLSIEKDGRIRFICGAYHGNWHSRTMHVLCFCNLSNSPSLDSSK